MLPDILIAIPWPAYALVLVGVICVVVLIYGNK